MKKDKGMGIMIGFGLGKPKRKQNVKEEIEELEDLEELEDEEDFMDDEEDYEDEELELEEDEEEDFESFDEELMIAEDLMTAVKKNDSESFLQGLKDLFAMWKEVE